MKKLSVLRQQLADGSGQARLCHLYCCGPDGAAAAAARYLAVLDGLERSFGPKQAAALFSAPGRTEIGGNHTDHQHGRVLAGSVNIDMIAAVAENDLGVLRLQSEGYALCILPLDDLDKRPQEENTTLALLRGVCRAFADRGAALRGLDVYLSSNVPKGSGISSSAAFEVLIGTVLNELCMNRACSAVEIAQIGQWAEKVYFGKPCGLMDQMACSVGGIIAIDFADPDKPVVTPVEVDLAKAGLALCILDSGADHAGLTGEYAAIPADCCAVAAACGGKVLREVPFELFLNSIPTLRTVCGDRAVLRAMHFYAENDRVAQQLQALRTGDFDAFLTLVNQSGDSSWQLLQNVLPAGSAADQELAVALAVAKQALKGRGAVRVHGGGFAGTMQAFVPLELLEGFRASVEKVLGAGSCHLLSIRPEGGVKL